MGNANLEISYIILKKFYVKNNVKPTTESCVFVNVNHNIQALLKKKLFWDSAKLRRLCYYLSRTGFHKKGGSFYYYLFTIKLGKYLRTQKKRINNKLVKRRYLLKKSIFVFNLSQADDFLKVFYKTNSL